MGQYVDIEDIESEFRKIDFGASGAAVSDAEVTEFIAQVEKYVEAKINCRYAVPITASAASPIVKTICTYIIKDRINKILKIKTGSNADQDETTNYLETAEEMLEAICKGDLKLIGATLVESGAGVKSWSNSNSSTFTRTFKRGLDQW